MRTAEEILEDFEANKEYPSYYHVNSVIQAMHLYGEEIITECANVAKSEWVRYGTNMGHAVEKQSILLLINELK